MICELCQREPAGALVPVRGEKLSLCSVCRRDVLGTATIIATTPVSLMVRAVSALVGFVLSMLRVRKRIPTEQWERIKAYVPMSKDWSRNKRVDLQEQLNRLTCLSIVPESRYISRGNVIWGFDAWLLDPQKAIYALSVGYKPPPVKKLTYDPDRLAGETVGDAIAREAAASTFTFPYTEKPPWIMIGSEATANNENCVAIGYGALVERRPHPPLDPDLSEGIYK